MIAVGVLTDGRAELLDQTIESFVRHVLGANGPRFIVNDSGDTDYTAWLRNSYHGWRIVHHSQRRGLAGAVQSVWHTAYEAGCDYLFHLEGDWTFNGRIDLEDVSVVLDANPHLAQMVLQRQALTGVEITNGGVAAGWDDTGKGWVEEDEIFSLNPCLIPRRVLEIGWPAGELGIGNEAGMTLRCRERGYRFGFWGEAHSAPQVHHIGDYRTADWSL